METQMNANANESGVISRRGAPALSESSPLLAPGTKKEHKVAYSIVERQGKSYWTRVGVAFTNRDGSITVKLDAVPISGTLQLREPAPREQGNERDGFEPRASEFTFGTPSDAPF